MSDLGKLYQQTILEHGKAPRHAVAVARPSHRAEATNPLCGDQVILTLEVSEGRVADVGCEVKGCAICRASGSMLAESVLGRHVSEAREASQRFLAAFEPEPAREGNAAAGEPWGPLAALLEARRYPNRQRCATLPWEVLDRVLRDAP